MQASQPCFFLVVSLFYLLNQYQGITAQEAVELGLVPRKWFSTGSSRAKRGSMTLKTLKPSQNDANDLKSDKTRLVGDDSPRRPQMKTIPNRLRSNKTYSTLSYKTGSYQNSRSDPKMFKTRDRKLRRFNSGLFVSSINIPSVIKETQNEGNKMRGETVLPRLNLTVIVPKFDECVHICLAHALCAGASFHVRNLICKLMDKMDDTRDKQLRHVGVEMQPSGSKDLNIFTVNPTVLTHILGKCADRPCTNGTFCSPSIEAGYTCLPLERFLRRIQKRNAEPDSDNQDFAYVSQAAELVRTKRSLREKREKKKPLKKGRSKPPNHVDCGLPPKLKKALSLFVNTLSGASATYYCEHGSHTSATNTNIHCQKNGKWTKPHFACVAQKHCGTPHKIPKTMMSFYTVNGVDMITYKCKINPTIKTAVKCNPHDGTWGNVHLKCNARPQGKQGLPRKNTPSKPRVIFKKKNHPRKIAHAKKKSKKSLATYARIPQRKSQALTNQTSPQKHSMTLHVSGSSDVKKPKSHNSVSVSKNSSELVTSKLSANKSKAQPPIKRQNAPETKPKSIKKKDPATFTRNTNNKTNTHKESNDKTPKKANQKNNKRTSSFTANKKAIKSKVTESKKLLNVSGTISTPKITNGSSPSSFARSIHNKSISVKEVNSQKPIKTNETNSKYTSSFTVHKKDSSPKVIVPAKSLNVSTTISKHPKVKNGSISNFTNSKIKFHSLQESNTHKQKKMSEVKRPGLRGSDKNNNKQEPRTSGGSNYVVNSNFTSKNQASYKNNIKFHTPRSTEEHPTPWTERLRNAASLTLDIPDAPSKSWNTEKKNIVHNIVENSVKNRMKESETLPTIGQENNSPMVNALESLFAKDYRLFLKTKFANELINMGVDGVVRANVNKRIGVPGFTCADPAKLQYATSFYGSRNIGSKMSFRCNQYFFSSPVPHCPLVTCLLQGLWSELFISCSDLDCINAAKMYVGKRTCTSSGFKCKRWDEAIIDPETIASLDFPEKDISLANNYCRDPLADGMVWCFTDDPTMIWDYCDVPFCN